MGDSSMQSRIRNQQKVAVLHEILRRLKELNVEEAAGPGFEDELWAHFRMLPLRYALDVDAEQATDVLIHKKLLNMARDPLSKPAVYVRLLQMTGMMMSETGLIIKEAHAFNTIDGYTFFAFVVDGWDKGIDHLRSALVNEIPNILATKENINV